MLMKHCILIIKSEFLVLFYVVNSVSVYFLLNTNSTLFITLQTARDAYEL